ncbi:MAG TPA: protein kinase [Candidatus Acidoferrum sp.]|nr:protein kinase [Candidatus Acidoferrum sp.]
MALTSGTRLGPYEIVASLGAGGMGEVYRAKDTRLCRDVAVKILPPSISTDPVAKQRFEREAKTISGLNHPNICVLHDVGSQDGVDYLVMECLEGETLGTRLMKGPLPLDQVLKYGTEIASALDKAHRSGVVHRDLKPGNVMLTAAGAKLLDFGLAKPALAAVGGLTLTGATSISPVTEAGVVVGTFQYMSPEQIEGKPIDPRSDIFSLGAVLYEMATGKKAFEGKSQLSVASAILEKDPAPIATIKPMTPPALDHVVKKCLAKDPETRWQSAGDLASELKWIAESSSQSQPAILSSRSSRTPRSWLAAGLAFLIMAAVLAVFFIRWAGRFGNTGNAPTRLSITLAPKQELAADVTEAVALSPDGKRVAYVASESGVSHLYVRRLDQFDPVAIPDSDGATFPFFSPNGDWIAFHSQGKLKKAPSDGGLPVALCEVTPIFGGTWTPRDILVISVPNFGLASVPAAGGTLQKISVAGKEQIYPQGLTWVADGDWVVFTNYFSSSRNIEALKLSTGELRPLLKDALSPAYSEGHLIYYQGGALWSVFFDSDKIEVVGTPVQIESGINEENYIAQATASRNGVFAYAPGPAGNFLRNLYLVNRKGEEKRLDVPPNDYVDPAFSPDGQRIAVVIRNIQELEVVERDRGTVSNISPRLAHFAPTWTADGKYLMLDAVPRDVDYSFAANLYRQRGIYRIAVDGGSEPQLLRSMPQVSHITSIAGQYAAMMVSDPVTNTDLWLMDLRSPFEMHSYKKTPAVERQGALSPDARWMAYASNDSGRSEIYVEPVPGPGGRKQISTEGGEQPRWLRNGREIIYRNGTKMMSVAVQSQPAFQAGKPVELFDRKFDRGAAVAAYDVTADGQIFVMTRSERENPTEIRVVIGWPEEKRKH